MVFPSLAWLATHAQRGPSSLLAPRLAPRTMKTIGFDPPNTGIRLVKKHGFTHENMEIYPAENLVV